MYIEIDSTLTELNMIMWISADFYNYSISPSHVLVREAVMAYIYMYP